MKIAELKEQISIREVLSEAGGSSNGSAYGTWTSVRCPFHEDRTASARVNDETGRFFCHGCGVAGDIIDLAKEITDLDTKGAMEWLSRTFL